MVNAVADRVAEQRVLAALLKSKWCYAHVSTLLRSASIGAPRGSARRALTNLTEQGCLVEWHEYPRGPRLITLTPLGAESLDLALIQPLQDEDREPRWGNAGIEPGGFYDQTGRYAEEPRNFISEIEWDCLSACGMRRSLTRFERIARARAVKTVVEVEAVLLDPESAEPVKLFGRNVPIAKKPLKGKKARQLAKAG